MIYDTWVISTAFRRWHLGKPTARRYKIRGPYGVYLKEARPLISSTCNPVGIPGKFPSVKSEFQDKVEGSARHGLVKSAIPITFKTLLWVESDRNRGRTHGYPPLIRSSQEVFNHR